MKRAVMQPSCNHETMSAKTKLILRKAEGRDRGTGPHIPVVPLCQLRTASTVLKIRKYRTRVDGASSWASELHGQRNLVGLQPMGKVCKNRTQLGNQTTTPHHHELKNL